MIVLSPGHCLFSDSIYSAIDQVKYPNAESSDEC